MSGQQGILLSTAASQSRHNHMDSSTATVKASSRHWPKTVCPPSEREDHCPCLVPLADYSDSVDSPKKGPVPRHVVLKLACEEEHMKMMVRKEVFELLKIPRELVHLKNKACKVSEREEEGEMFFAATLTGENHTACGSVIQQNSSHVSYFNIIESEQEAHRGVISRSFQLEVHFSCIYAYEQMVKLPFALTAVDKLVQFVVREGHFNVSMRLYKTSSYLQPYHLPTAAVLVMDTLYVLLKIEGQHQLKYFVLSVEDCWATPSADPYQDMRHKLIEKGCPHDETVTYLNAIGESTTAKFSFQMFQFVGYPEVFLYCHVRLCLPDSPEPCAKQCPRHWRRKRALADDYNKIVSYGPIHLLAAPSLGAESHHSRTDQQDLEGDDLPRICPQPGDAVPGFSTDLGDPDVPEPPESGLERVNPPTSNSRKTHHRAGPAPKAISSEEGDGSILAEGRWFVGSLLTPAKAPGE
ncbi:uromodulin-like [Mycteria americana]|uniref:uromodulin-like n=1 Tax=Mycteria americana TaxID=33587 RepID=UPI003F5890FD